MLLSYLFKGLYRHSRIDKNQFSFVLNRESFKHKAKSNVTYTRLYIYVYIFYRYIDRGTIINSRHESSLPLQQ